MILLNKNVKRIILAAVLILLLFFLHTIGILKPIENFFSYVTRPVMEFMYSVSNKVGQNYLFLKNKQQLIDENETMKNELIKMKKEKAVCFEEMEENKFLREQVGFVQDQKYEYEIANVIGRNEQGIENLLIINKGEKYNLKVGQPVVTGENVLIGKIFMVEKNKAYILLLNDDISQVASKIQNQENTVGLVEGSFGLGMKMNLIPQIENIQTGQMVVTSGLEELVPSGLLIGEIDEVENQPEELFQSASIKSFVDFNKVLIVSVIKNG